MSKLAMSFEEFCAAAAHADTIIVDGNGIVHKGQRYNHRKLRRYRGRSIRVHIDKTPIGAFSVCFALTGEFICLASPKRRYDDSISTFVKALDFDPNALHKLYLKPSRDGRPWHVHLADVKMSVMEEGSGAGPYVALLTWKGEGA